MSFPWAPHGLFYRGVSSLVRANHGPCFAARRILLYHPVPKSPTVTLDLPATHHPHSAVRGAPSPPKHTLLRTQLAWTTQYILWRRILQKSGGAACPVFLPWALTFRPGPSRLPFRAGMQLPGSFAAVLLEALQAWPAWPPAKEEERIHTNRHRHREVPTLDVAL